MGRESHRLPKGGQESAPATSSLPSGLHSPACRSQKENGIFLTNPASPGLSDPPLGRERVCSCAAGPYILFRLLSPCPERPECSGSGDITGFPLGLPLGVPDQLAGGKGLDAPRGAAGALPAPWSWVSTEGTFPRPLLSVLGGLLPQAGKPR